MENIVGEAKKNYNNYKYKKFNEKLSMLFEHHFY